MDETSKRIKELIQILGLTQAKFAKDVGISPGNLSDWFGNSKKSKPSAQALLKIGRTYKISTHWLLSGEGEIFYKSVPGYTKRRKLLSKYEQTDKINNLSKQIDKLKAENKQLKEKIIKLVDKIVKD